MVESFLEECTEQIREIIGDNLVGVYLHGSLVLGGFIPEKSDVDLIVVTEKRMTREDAELLTYFLLDKSQSPFPIELSVVNRNQLNQWQHPSLYDYHYSEAWRERFLNGKVTYKQCSEQRDADLAAHLTIIIHKGRVLYGNPICEVFSDIPKKDYLDSIINDYEDCLEDVLEDPVYGVLNILRVYLYLLEDRICSKDEAGRWAMNSPYASTVGEVLKRRRGEAVSFSDEELLAFKGYYEKKVEAFIK